MEQVPPCGPSAARAPQCSAITAVPILTFGKAVKRVAFDLLGWSAAYTLVAINSISYRQLVTPEPRLGRVSTAARMLSRGIRWTGGAPSAAYPAGAGHPPAMIALTSVSVVAVALAWLSPLRWLLVTQAPYQKGIFRPPGP